jgi:hypothetical protein
MFLVQVVAPHQAPACERSTCMRCIRDKRGNIVVLSVCAKMPLAVRSMVPLVVFAAVALILHPRPTSSLQANKHIPNHSYFPPHSPAARNISNMVLLYADSRSLGHKVLIVCFADCLLCGLTHVQDDEFHLNAAKVRALLQCDESSSSGSSSSFFDTVLVTGYAWDNMQKCFWPGQVVRVRSSVSCRVPLFSP